MESQKQLCRAALLCSLLLNGGCSEGEIELDHDEPAGDATIPDSEQWTIESQITNRTYQIQVSFPREYDTVSVPYQAVYLLDANGQFGMTTEIVRNLTYFDADSSRGLIVVGVGYPVGAFYNALGVRVLDLTPHSDATWDSILVAVAPEVHPVVSGDAAGFLDFLSRELIPRVESDYRVDGSTRTVIGHSLGGLFALYALLEQPEAFQQYLVISPSLWWKCGDDTTVCLEDASAPDGWVLRREEELYEAGSRLSGRLYLTVGDEEIPTMIEGPRRLAARLQLRDYADLDWTFQMIPGEWHMSIPPSAISAGLRWLHFDSGADR